MVPYLDIHAFSAVLFIVVGILLTHALWFNWWSSEDEQQTDQSVSQLTAELSRQRSMYDVQREAHEQLQGEYETTQRDWVALRQENEHLKTRERERQRAWANHDASLRKLQDFKHEAVIGLEQERHRRAIAESGIRSANTAIAQLKSELAVAGDEGAAAAELRQLHDQHNRERSQWEDRRRALSLELAQLNQQLADVSERQQAEDHAVERLRRERDEIRQQHSEETQRREALEESVKAKERVIKQLAADSQSLKSMREKQATFQATREADCQQIGTLQEQVQRMQNDNQTVLAQVESLHKRLEAEQAEIRNLEKEKQDLAQSLQVQGEKTFTLEAALATNSKNARTLQETSQSLADLQSRQQQTQTALQEATDKLEKVTADRDELRKTSNSLLQQIRELNERIDAEQQSQQQLRQQRDAAGNSARTYRQRLASLQAELEMMHERIAAFEKETPSLHELRAQQGGFQRSLQECANRLKLVTEERDEKAADLDRSCAEIASLRSQLHQLETKQNQEAHRTQQQLIALRQKRQAVGELDTQDVAYPGKTRRDNRLGVVYTEEPEQKDDLRLIQGITEVVEQRLNDFGVHTYRQIMEWDSIAVEEFTRLLSVKDRILSDDWMGQARTLHAKYHEQAA